MKALACLAVCFALASFSTPAAAGARLGASRPWAPPIVISGRHHVGRNGAELVWFGGGDGPGSFAPPEVGGEEPPPFVGARAVAFASVSPAPRGATEAPAAAPSPGPHIIYIGQQPTIHGPKVIYGTP
jgi:hypothetical protein